MYEVVYLPTARRQLVGIVDYIALELKNPDAAAAFLDALDATAQGLSEMPYRHPVYQSRFTIPGEIRRVSVKRYSLFYKVNEETKTVEIRRILHELRETGA